MPEVVVIIVSYKSVKDISSCLAALEKSTHQNFRIVICENGGAAAYERMCAALPDRLAGGQGVEAVLAPGNLGYAGGINFALNRTPAADAYWILNPDCEAAPTALAAMLERLARGDCDAVGHDLVLPSGRLASRAGGRWGVWTARPISMEHGGSRETPVDVQSVEARMDYIIGASMLVSQRFLDRNGLMREDYFLYCEEIEWCLRAIQRGERLGYAPTALALHAHGTSTGGGGALNQRSKVAVYLNERNRILLTRDLYPARLPIVTVAVLIHVTFKYLKAAAWRQLGYAVSGWAAGVRNERGRPTWFADS